MSGLEMHLKKRFGFLWTSMKEMIRIEFLTSKHQECPNYPSLLRPSNVIFLFVVQSGLLITPTFSHNSQHQRYEVSVLTK